MEDSMQSVGLESEIFSPANRIAELNEIDKVRIIELGYWQCY